MPMQPAIQQSTWAGLQYFVCKRQVNHGHLQQEGKDYRDEQRKVVEHSFFVNVFVTPDGTYMRQLGDGQYRKYHGLPVGMAGMEGPGLDAQGKGGHQKPYPNNVDADAIGKQAFIGLPRRTFHHILVCRFCR